ncbi:MAG: helix-turn-helix domain-containing protein [Gemmatimonadota bacterium]
MAPHHINADAPAREDTDPGTSTPGDPANGPGNPTTVREYPIPDPAHPPPTRDRIVKAALDLFAHHGFAATSVRRIAEEAGVSQGLLYNYFGGKEELLGAIFEEGMTDVRASFEVARAEAEAEFGRTSSPLSGSDEPRSSPVARTADALTPPAPPGPAPRRTDASRVASSAFTPRHPTEARWMLTALIRAAFRIVAEHRAFWQLSYQLRMQSEVAQGLDNEIREWSREILAELDLLLSAAGVPPGSPAPRALFAAIDGAAQHYVLDPEGYPVEEVASEIALRFSGPRSWFAGPVAETRGGGQ